MLELIPAILPKTFSDIEEQLARIQNVGGFVQIDLVGKNVLAGQEAMPRWEGFDFEFDIMLSNPAAEVTTCVGMGASRIVVHAAASSALEAVQSLQHLRGGTYATEVGVALKVSDEPSALTPFEGLYDYVQVMGIDIEGVQGQPFDEKAITLVGKLRATSPTLIIQVDGGVDALQIPRLKAAGANRLVIGHAIFSAQDPLAAYADLAKEAQTS